MTRSDIPVSDAVPVPEGSLTRFSAFSPSAIVVWVIVGGALLRLIAAAMVGMDMDGTYSAVIARDLSWSYFDHPPVHYWLIWLSTHIFGNETGFVVRLPFIVLFAGSTWLMYKLVAHVHSAWAGVWAVLALNLCGAFTLAYSWFVVPDGPLLFFLLLAAYPFSRLVFDASDLRHPLLYWLATGAAGGAAMLSKYTGVFFFGGALLFLLTSKRLRSQLWTANPWLGVLAGLLVFSPVLIWNVQHQWISIAFQGERAAPDFTGGLRHVWGSLLGQLGYLVPWFGLWMGYVLAKSALRGPTDERRWFFVCLSVGPIIVLTLVNFLQQGNPHWTIPGWLMVLPLLGIEVAGMSARWRNLMARLAAVGCLIVVLAFGVGIVQARTGAVSNMATKVWPLSRITKRDPFLDLLNWTAIRAELEQRGLLKDTDFVSGLFAIATAKVGYGFGPSYKLLCLCHEVELHHYRFVQNERAFAHTNGLVIVYDYEEAALRDVVKSFFDRVDPPVHIAIYRGDLPVLRFSVFRGFGFKPRSSWAALAEQL